MSRTGDRNDCSNGNRNLPGGTGKFAGGGSRFGIGCFLLLAALGPWTAVRAQVQPEYKFKAAYLFHFPQFVDWPAEAFPETNAPLVIAVLGENVFGDALETALRGKSINSHPFLSRTLSSASEARTNCHVLFISASEKPRLREILAELRGTSVLTVSDMDRFAEEGGMIRLHFVDKKLKFQIRDEPAKKAGLNIRANLLTLSVEPER